MKSRKTWGTIIAVVGAILAVFKDQFGLEINPTEVLSGVGALLVYIALEGKLDLARIKEQVAKFADPKFYFVLATTLLTALTQVFAWALPLEVINTALAALMSIVFGIEYYKLKA